MTDPPSLDGRRQEELRDAILERAPSYLPSWDPETDEVGGALVDLFAEFASELTQDVDRLPRKHLTQLYAELGFNRQPPQPATVPVTFAIDPDAPHPIAIPAETELDAETEEGETHFRIVDDHAFEATPARIEAVYTIDPAADRVVDHAATLGGEQATTLFHGEDIQEHHCYIGDPEWLAVTSGSTINVQITTDEADPREVRWEYFAAEDGENRWLEFDDENRVWADGTLELTPTAELVETTVDGIESYWLRSVLPDDDNPEDVPMSVTDLAFDGVRNEASIDAMYANDVPRSVDAEAIEPFGAIPQLRDAFYVASATAFTKTGAEVTLRFTAWEPSLDDSDFELSWEYFNGQAWRSLPELATDATDAGDLEVRFEVPDDITETSVAGTDGVWVRVRLVGGDYIRSQFAGRGRGTEGDPPAFTDLEVSYEYFRPDPPAHVLRWNANAYDSPSIDGETAVDLFEPLVDDEQSLYIGFDQALDGGPYQLYFELMDLAYDDTFSPRVRWEYRATGDDWRPATVTDGTDGLLRSGIVRFTFDPAMRPSERFGHELHWLRARVRGEPFLAGKPSESTVSTLHHHSRVPIDPRPPDERRSDLEPWAACRPTLETAHGGGGARFAPVCQGMFPNTTVAEHVENVQERLGSSTGRPEQTFTVERPPIIDLEVWVEESGTITDEGLERLRSRQPTAVEVDWGRDDAPRTAWIRWSPVTDLEGFGSDDRHYEVDRIDGEIVFGDGVHGRIPPAGDENIRLEYQTGGGSVGNVGRDAIEDLGEPITYVEDVRNPVEAAGGGDEETTDSVRERAPAQLRTRGRAVTASDYEHLALQAVRELAAVRCIRDMNEVGERAPGWVTVLIVPESRQDPPEPTVGLEDQVEAELAERAPHGVVADERLVVRGPTYVDVAVRGTIVVDGVDSQSAFEARIRDQVAAFLHPLTGNGGGGWSFGELPTVSSVIAEIERLDPVDHVPDIRLSYGDEATIVPGEAPPHVDPDVLITSGAHEFEIRSAGREGR